MTERAAGETTEGHLLDGKLRYRQPRTGYRTGLEPVLLASAIPARAGQSVLEAGTGAGAAALCLAWRVPGVAVTALERDPAMAALARANVASNVFTPPPGVIAGDILDPAIAPGPFAHACANPPWHDAAGTVSPYQGRDAAKRAAPALLETWSSALARRLAPRGTLTLILPSAAWPEAATALRRAGCGELVLFPLWPQMAVPAKLMLVQAVRGARGPARILPGLVLHEGAQLSEAAERILRRGEAWPAAAAHS